MEFKDNATYNKDFNAIMLALSKIIDKGALERFFRIEGRINDHFRLCLSIPANSTYTA